MTELFGQAFWPGLRDGFLECSGTCSWGITPGTATLTIPVGKDGGIGLIAETGDLTFQDGVGGVTWRDCKIVRPAEQTDASGQRMTLLIEDRRWRWKFGQISGRYNVPAERTSTVQLVPDPTAPLPELPPPPFGEPPPPVAGEEAVQPWTAANAQDLARLCLEAMGEVGYDVSALDNSATPSVEWDATNPAAALQSLTEGLGCVVVLRHDSDNVVLYKRGEGQPMPDGPFTSESPGFDVKARPKSLQLYGARARIQMRFVLEAVGRDFNGAIKPIEELSYAVDGDWRKIGPPTFVGLERATGLPGGRTKDDAMALAMETVFRMYRIKKEGADGGPLVVPPRGRGRGEPLIPSVTINRIQQIRLLPIKNVTVKDDLGRESSVAATCYGVHEPPLKYKIGEKAIVSAAATTINSEVNCPFSIDAEHQCIIFARHVYNFQDGEYSAAPIVLETACEVQDPATNQYLRYFRELPFPGGMNTKPAVIVNENVRYLITAEYARSSFSSDITSFVTAQHIGNKDNSAGTRRRADFYLNGEAVRYLPAEVADRNFCGIVPVFPDGAIQQVSWAVGGGTESNPSTRVSRNTEHALYLPTYEARRRIEDTALAQGRRVQRPPNLGSATLRSEMPEVTQATLTVM